MTAPPSDRPKFSVFPSPAANVVLSSLSGGLLVELWPQVKAMATQFERLGSLRSFFETLAAERPGSHENS